MRTFFRLALLLLILPLGAALRAQDPSYRYQGSIILGEGQQREMTSTRMGYSFGMHGLYQSGTGEYFRPRADITLYPEVTWATVQTSGSNLALGCDYIQYLPGSASVFVDGGLAMMIWSGTTANRPIPAGTGDTTRLAFNLGLGFKVNEILTYEIRLTRSSLSKEFSTESIAFGFTVRI
jgi:hypothetical protein